MMHLNREQRALDKQPKRRKLSQSKFTLRIMSDLGNLRDLPPTLIDNSDTHTDSLMNEMTETDTNLINSLIIDIYRFYNRIIKIYRMQIISRQMARVLESSLANSTSIISKCESIIGFSPSVLLCSKTVFISK